MPPIDFNLYLITDRLNLPAGKDLVAQVEAALRGGVRGVQLREKDLLFHQLLPIAQQLRQLTRRYGARLLINGNLDVALSVEADGIHLPSHNPPVALARNILGKQALIGVSTHTLSEVNAAEQAGADFVTFGPVYATASKAGLGVPTGHAPLREACRQAGIPVFALGGVTPERVAELHDVGCSYFACIGALLNAEKPQITAEKFLAVQK